MDKDNEIAVPQLPTGSPPRASVQPAQALRAARGGVSAGAVAVLPLTGVLTPRGSFLSLLFGGAAGGLMDFRAAFGEAVASPDVAAIVLDVDSPGGLVDLVPETAAEVRGARGSKPIVAVANTQASSAAFWIATQADELVVTPSGLVGSVGVYGVHEDWSRHDRELGVDTTFIYAGRFKVEGNAVEPLSDEAREVWQQDVDDLYAMFLEDVAAGRGVTVDAVRDGYGEGRTLNATRAVEAGMADRVATLESVVGSLVSTGGQSARALAQDQPVKIEAAAIYDALREALELPAESTAADVHAALRGDQAVHAAPTLTEPDADETQRRAAIASLLLA
jgi:signal peptide peptidase SppA